MKPVIDRLEPRGGSELHDWDFLGCTYRMNFIWPPLERYFVKVSFSGLKKFLAHLSSELQPKQISWSIKKSSIFAWKWSFTFLRDFFGCTWTINFILPPLDRSLILFSFSGLKNFISCLSSELQVLEVGGEMMKF